MIIGTSDSINFIINIIRNSCISQAPKRIIATSVARKPSRTPLHSLISLNIEIVAEANNRRTFNIIYLHYSQITYGKQNKLNVFGQIDYPSSEHD